ncbi:hypothetical protein ACFL4D_00440 [Candidatus Margulisiibacteriota bacterium]
MKNKLELKTLQAELGESLALVKDWEKNYELISVKITQIAPDQFDYAGLGYTIHNLYNAMENSFYRIARHFENNIDKTMFHKDLLRRMAIEINDVRPSIISKETYLLIDELRAFRHAYRHIYENGLDTEKLLGISAKVPAALSGYYRDLAGFTDFLNNLEESWDETI